MVEDHAGWLWDRRTNKAYYPVATTEDTVEFRTVWHDEEVADARESGALVPIEETGIDNEGRLFGLTDSFRVDTNGETAADN